MSLGKPTAQENTNKFCSMKIISWGTGLFFQILKSCLTDMAVGTISTMP